MTPSMVAMVVGYMVYAAVLLGAVFGLAANLIAKGKL